MNQHKLAFKFHKSTLEKHKMCKHVFLLWSVSEGCKLCVSCSSRGCCFPPYKNKITSMFSWRCKDQRWELFGRNIFWRLLQRLLCFTTVLSMSKFSRFSVFMQNNSSLKLINTLDASLQLQKNVSIISTTGLFAGWTHWVCPSRVTKIWTSSLNAWNRCCEDWWKKKQQQHFDIWHSYCFFEIKELP